MSDSIEVFKVDQVERAKLYRMGAQPGVRTALWVELDGADLPAGHCLADAAGFWLLESAQGLVGCYASATPSNGRNPGGRVVHDLPFLKPRAPWLARLAQDLARASGAPETVEHGALEGAVSAFCSELDPEILTAVREDEEATASVYNHYCQSSLQRRRNRLQAALTHPRFAAALRDDWCLRQSVDRGVALTPRLAGQYQIRTATVRRVRALARECVPPKMLAVALKQVDTLPAQALPVSPGDWAVYLRLAPGLATLQQRAAVPQAQLLKPFRAGWAKGLADLERRLQAPLDLDVVLETMHCAYHYGVRPAVAADLSGAGRTPDLAESAPAPFFPLWFGRYGLARLAEMAQRWHEAHGQFSLERLGGARGKGRGGALDWPPLLETGASHGGLRVVELASRAALELEGQRLGHCVASYAIKCLLAESAIFSIRDAAGVPLSTFEVRVPTEGAAELLQHHAAGNEPPSAGEQAVARRFVERVLRRIPRERVRAVQQTRRELGLRVRGLLGRPDTLQEPLGETEVARLGEAISVAHPAEARRMGLVPFLHEHGADVLAAMGVAGGNRGRRNS